MDKTTLRRFAISTAETFAATFLATFALLLDTAVSSGNVDSAMLVSCASGALVAGTKVALKIVREAALRYLSANAPEDGGSDR